MRVVDSIAAEMNESQFPGGELESRVVELALEDVGAACEVNDGVVELLNVEAPMKLEVSDAETILAAL